MPGFIESLINGTKLQQGVLVMLGGMAGVFIVLILFYFLIKLLEKIFPYKPEEG